MAQMRTMDLWYTRLDIDDIAAQMQQQLNRTQQKRFTRNVAKARTKDSIKAFDKLVRVVDGQPQARRRPTTHRPDRRPVP